jgi:hypothetical protein
MSTRTRTSTLTLKFLTRSDSHLGGKRINDSRMRSWDGVRVGPSSLVCSLLVGADEDFILCRPPSLCGDESREVGDQDDRSNVCSRV